MAENINKILKYIIQRYTMGSIGYDDLQILIEYCQNKNSVVELGTNIGTTSRLLSMVCDSVYTVDIFEDVNLIEDLSQREIYSKSFGKNQHTFERICGNLADRNNVIVIKQLSYKAAAMFSESSVDVLFIDADHSKEGTKKDYDSWFTKVKENGIFLFHDMIPAFGCYELYDNLLNDSRIQEIKHNFIDSSIKIFQKRAV